MKASIASTTAVVEMKDSAGRTFRARVWEGLTECGVKFTAYIGVVEVHKGDDNSVFERELSEHTAPRVDTQRAIDARFII